MRRMSWCCARSQRPSLEGKAEVHSAGLVARFRKSSWYTYTDNNSSCGTQSPVDVSLRIHSPSHSVPPSPTEYEMIPRAVYACIILRHSGPQTPFGASALHDAVPFRLELEPLVLGAVPPSVIPIVAASLTTVVGVAHLLYPWLQAAIARGSLEGQDRKSS